MKKTERPMEDLLKRVVKDPNIPDITLWELKIACQCNSDTTTTTTTDTDTSSSESSKTLWVGCKGRIFNVGATEEGKEFYGEDGSYNILVGMDASVALGKMLLNHEYLDPTQMHWSRDLNQKELNTLEDWVEKFEGKYPLVGYIKNDGGVDENTTS